MDDSRTAAAGGERLAKVMARSGLCSRRDAEEWIKAGRVKVNGTKVITPAFNVTDADEVVVDNTPLAARQGTRVWLYHKPRGLVVTEKDPEGRPTVFDTLAEQGLPRVLSVGRLDINTEGLLLLTNDGGLKRVLELPATGWLRKYRVRAHGTVTQAQLDKLKHGVEVDGIKYGPIEATMERDQGANVWMEVALREGKNREIKNVLMSLGLEVNRLIRISFGPFQLGDLPIGAVETVKARVLKDQLGKRLAEEAEVDFDSEMPDPVAARRTAPASRRATAAAAEERQFGRGTHTVEIAQQRFRFTDKAEMTPEEAEAVRMARPRPARPGRGVGDSNKRAAPRDETPEPERRIHFDDGREPAVFEEKTYGKRPKPGDKPAPKSHSAGPAKPGRSFGDKPRGATRAGPGQRPGFGDKPPRGRGADDGARPPRGYNDKDRAPRTYGDKPRTTRPTGTGQRPERGSDAARPARPYTGKPRPLAGAADGAARPARAYSPKPRAAAGAEGAARPTRAYSPKPRSAADGAARPARAYAPKPRAAGATEGAARPARSFAGKPKSAEGAARPSRAPGGKPVGDRPRSARPAGTGPRPPRKDGPPRAPGKPRGK